MIVFPEWLCSFFFGLFFSKLYCPCKKKEKEKRERKKNNICRNNEKLLISVYHMHAVEGNQKNVILQIDLECMVTFYKGILNKTYLYILINSLVWREICSVGDDDIFSFVGYFPCFNIFKTLNSSDRPSHTTP